MLLVKKLVFDPVIVNQNKSRPVSFTGSKIYVSHKLLTPSWNLYQVLEFDVLSHDLVW